MAIDVTPYPEHLKALATPEADYLAELYLIKGDLDAAHATLSLYFDRFTPDRQLSGGEQVISSSLFRDGIILYCACFSTSDPNKLNPEAVYGHLEGWKDYCQKLLDMRNAFAAHNFGPMRQHKIVVIALEIGGKLVPAGFNQVFLRFAGWIPGEGPKLLQYIDVARDYLQKQIEEAERPILKMLETITSDELAALPDAEGFLTPEPRDIKSTRQTFRRRGRGERVPLPPRRWIQTIEGELEPHRLDPQRSDPDEEAPLPRPVKER
jgi:hypothetical protein